MIDQLSIESLGVIEKAELSFSPGLTAITGETGAGKTMLLTSVGFLLGAQADPSKVRHGCQRAIVDGSFAVGEESGVVDTVENAGGDVDREDGMALVSLSRHVPAEGRSRCYLGGRGVPRAVVQSIAEDLVAIHGQAEQMRLRTRAAQLGAVDRGGGSAVETAREAYAAAWAELRHADEEFDAFEHALASHSRERLALTALVEAVSKLDPYVGEEDEIKAKIDALDTIEERRSALLNALSLVTTEEQGASDLARRAANAISDIDGGLQDKLEAIAEDLVEIGRDISRHLSDLDITESIDDLHSRRAALIELGRTLGMTVDEAVVGAEDAQRVLAAMEDPLARREQLEQDRQRALTAVTNAGRTLHRERVRSAHVITEAIANELSQLALGRARVEIRVEEVEPGPSGMTQVEFLLQPDAHSDPLPLAKAASGGELSRIMLALELVLADLGPTTTPTFIFDEIDAGVGGEAALAIGQRLAVLARSSQVIVVTHLAQVASWADQQIVVERGDGRTDVRTLSPDERVAELARMLSGHTTDSALRHAADLLEQSNMAP